MTIFMSFISYESMLLEQQETESKLYMPHMIDYSKTMLKDHSIKKSNILLVKHFVRHQAEKKSKTIAMNIKEYINS